MSYLRKTFGLQIQGSGFKVSGFVFGMFFLAFVFATKAQTCSVVFQSADTNLYFTSKLNQKIQHSVFVNNIRLTGLEANNKYLAQSQFKNDTTELRTTLFLLDAGFTHFYQVDKNGIYLKKMVPSLGETPDPNQYLVVCEGFNRPIKPLPALVDTTTKDSVAFQDHYQMEGYEGKIGCPYPIKEEELAKLRLILLNETLEDNKLEKVKTAIQDMEAPCFTIDQLKILIPLFEYEETKLAFAKVIVHSIFDVDHVGNLSSVFDFENSIDELKQAIHQE